MIAPLKPGAFERSQLENLEGELETIAADDDHDAEPELQLVFARWLIRRRTSRVSSLTDSKKTIREYFEHCTMESCP